MLSPEPSITPLSRIQNVETAHTARHVAVIGLGYAGLPLCVALSRHHKVVGYDTNKLRVSQLQNGYDRNGILDTEALQASNFSIAEDISAISDCDFYIIVVQTPLKENNELDLAPILGATRMVGKHLKPGDIVVYESTIYPGATEELCIPALEQESGLKSSVDFAVGYSPERISCGDPQFTLDNTVKLISAQNKETLSLIKDVYEPVISGGIHEAPTIRVAETAKLVENIQRDVNVALMNEVALICNSLGISTNDVLEAAGTKKNFANFKPGLVGGHCISVDPYYLIHKAQESGCATHLISASRKINDAMPKYIADRTLDAIAERLPKLSCTRIGVLGLTFKENCADFRDSRAIELVRELRHRGVEVLAFDPLLTAMETHNGCPIELSDWQQLKDLSAVVVAVAHNEFRSLKAEDFSKILLPGAPIIDVKGLYGHGEFARSGLHVWQL